VVGWRNIPRVNITVHQLNTELSERGVAGEFPVEVIHQLVIVVARNPAGRERGGVGSTLEIIVASGGAVAIWVDESDCEIERIVSECSYIYIDFYFGSLSRPLMGKLKSNGSEAQYMESKHTRDTVIVNSVVRTINSRSGDNALDNQVLELRVGWLSGLKTSHTCWGKILLLGINTRRDVRFLGDGISGGHETGDETEESEELHFDGFAGGGSINSDRMNDGVRSSNVDPRDF
jgi:hypothetical protein